MRRTKVVVVDDDPNFLKVIHGELEEMGYGVVSCASASEAISVLGKFSFDVLLVDLHMPEMSGIDLLRSVKEEALPLEVIILTGGGDVGTAVEAMKGGAYDYVLKPLDLAKLSALIDKAAEKAALQRENVRLHRALRRSGEAPAILGESRAIGHSLALARRAAGSSSPVLIRGETGTGKELFARLIHREGVRSREPMITVNCATLPETLIESELFGHRKGAFTGATAGKEGMFELADGGTIFLDEVGEIPVALQAKLLRVLQFGEVKRLGDASPRTVDVHVIAATSKDLGAESAAGRFREDLYYRLNVIEIPLPPLRDRTEDIPVLVGGILDRWAGSGRPRRFSERSMALLRAYTWPGNVRQLENLVERSLVLSDEEEIDLERAPFGEEIRAVLGSRADKAALTLEEAQRQHIVGTLERTGGNRAEAARVLGISKRSLYYKIKALGLDA